jgi:hypothetical protein
MCFLSFNRFSIKSSIFAHYSEQTLIIRSKRSFFGAVFFYFGAFTFFKKMSIRKKKHTQKMCKIGK